jgi:hypothetical protein
MPYGIINSDLMTTSDGVSSAGLYGFKNKLINGNCAISQRPSLSTTNANGYFVDRFWGFSGLSTAATFSQISSTGLAGFPYAARGQRNSGNTGTAGVYIGQIIETNNVQDIAGQTITVSFWARAGANYSGASNALLCRVVTGTGSDQGLTALISTWTGQVVAYSSNVTLTTSWQKFSYQASIGSTVNEIDVDFSNQTTGAGTAGANDYFDVTGIQVEIGSSATSFDTRPYGLELSLCQRYCQAINTYAGNVLTNNQLSSPLWFRTTMRSAPTLASGGSYAVSAGSAGVPGIITAAAYLASGNSILTYNSSNNWSANANVTINAIFTAEL